MWRENIIISYSVAMLSDSLRDLYDVTVSTSQTVILWRSISVIICPSLVEVFWLYGLACIVKIHVDDTTVAPVTSPSSAYTHLFVWRQISRMRFVVMNNLKYSNGRASLGGMYFGPTSSWNATAASGSGGNTLNQMPAIFSKTALWRQSDVDVLDVIVLTCTHLLCQDV